jgi:hypothetical protein
LGHLFDLAYCRFLGIYLFHAYPGCFTEEVGNASVLLVILDEVLNFTV